MRAQPDARGPQAVARDLVDDDRIEVVHGRVAVAVERGGGRLGGSAAAISSSVACTLVVERRAPERVPGAVAVVEVRVDEALGDGAVRELDDREDRRALPPASAGAVSASRITSRTSRLRAAESDPSESRVKRDAVASCCQTSSSTT